MVCSSNLGDEEAAGARSHAHGFQLRPRGGRRSARGVGIGVRRAGLRAGVQNGQMGTQQNHRAEPQACAAALTIVAVGMSAALRWSHMTQKSRADDAERGHAAQP